MKKIVFSVKNSNYCLFSNTMISLMSKFKQTYFLSTFGGKNWCSELSLVRAKEVDKGQSPRYLHRPINQGSSREMFLCSPKFSGRRQSLFKKSLEQYGQIQQTTFFQLERRQSFCFLYYRPLSVTYTTEQQLKEAGKVRAKKEDRLTLISDPCENPDKYVECQNGIDYHVTESIYICTRQCSNELFGSIQY